MNAHPSSASTPRPSPLLTALAFGVVYVVWGATYLAIRFAVETVPPFVMAAGRHLTAGLILYALVRARGTPPPQRMHWRSAFLIGAMLLTVANGSVVWAESGGRVPSGLTALIVATVAFWMALFDWLRPGGKAPALQTVVGLVVGFGGVALLVSPGELAGGKPVDLWGATALMLCAFSWAAGSVYAQRAPLPKSMLQATAMEMIAGGALLLIVATVAREWPAVHLAAITAKSAVSFAFLVVFGSLLAFTAYIYMLRVATPVQVSTYAFVNPAVALLLGWAFAGEALTPRSLLAAALIIVAVVVILWSRSRATAPGREMAAAVVETAGE